jgi:hypothetical protein
MTHGGLAVILEGHGMRVRPRHSGFQSQCPAHSDTKRKRALSIGLGRDGRQLMHCHAGCGFDDVRSALNLPAEAFVGWDSYNQKRLSGTSPAFSVTLSISGVRVLNAGKLLERHRDGKLNPAVVVLPLPPRTRHATRTVAADLGLLFGLADAAGAGHFPLMYSARWAARRLGVADHSTVARALTALIASGAIERAKSVPAWNGRATRTYRRAGR